MREIENKLVDMLSSNSEINPEELCLIISDVVNSFIRPSKELIEKICENPKASSRMSQISWYWIKAVNMYYENEIYDDRNHFSCERCNQIYHSPTGNNYINEYTPAYNEDDFNYSIKSLLGKRIPEYLVSLCMCREHRTLQQTFTGLVFTYLTKTSEEFRTMTKEIKEYELGYMMVI